jgi:O-acetyl-ADP-ribose deacetylase (regulator of RNase III)
MREVEGSLLSIAEQGEAFGHGCNCEGVMGGLAAKVEQRWPAMAAEYRARCDDGTFTLGGVLPWLDEETGVWIYNLATQQRPGPDAKLEAIADSVRAAIDHAPKNGVRTIYLPRIGSGIGGLDWDDVRATLERVDAEAAGVELVVVSLPN